MLWIIASIAVWGLFHSLLASDGAKRTARRLAGSAGVRYYRLGYNLFACISFLPILALFVILEDQLLYTVKMPWSVLMVAGQLAALAVLMLAFRQTDAWEFLGVRQARRDAEAGDQDDPLAARQGVLITGGFYRLVRHLLYTAGLAFIWLMPVMTRQVLAANIGLSLYILAGAFFEERKLLCLFGQAYRTYSAVTPMLIPFTRRNKAGKSSSM
jgi:protein-S-isoprenylcysteine O-methyltransferase Ste14